MMRHIVSTYISHFRNELLATDLALVKFLIDSEQLVLLGVLLGRVSARMPLTDLDLDFLETIVLKCR